MEFDLFSYCASIAGSAGRGRGASASALSALFLPSALAGSVARLVFGAAQVCCGKWSLDELVDRRGQHADACGGFIGSPRLFGIEQALARAVAELAGGEALGVRAALGPARGIAVDRAVGTARARAAISGWSE